MKERSPGNLCRWLAFALTVWVALISAREAAAQSPIKGGDRIVFVGDSITGQGAKGGKTAWIGLIGEGLGLVRPNAKPTLIGLGGSGSTVGAWLNHERNSRTKPVALDVKPSSSASLNAHRPASDSPDLRRVRLRRQPTHPHS